MNKVVAAAIRRMTASLLLIGWTLAWATAAALPPDLAGLPWAQVAVGVLIAGWGGLTATLGRRLTAAYEGRVFNMRAELARDGAVSVTVGSGGYLFGAWNGVDPMLLGVSLLLSGYGGARVLSAGADRLLEAIRGRGGQEG